jgi:NitT/TauT family transport system substrate-binding protein
MQTLHNRRDFLTSASLAGAASFLGHRASFAQEAPPETATVRIPTGTLICNAPTYIADELLRAEGFTDIQHVPTTTERVGPGAMQHGELDFAMAYTPNVIATIESGSPVTVLAGVHVGCNSLFAHEGIRTVRDLKGKKVSAGLVRQSLIASMAAYVLPRSCRHHPVTSAIRAQTGPFAGRGRNRRC